MKLNVCVCDNIKRKSRTSVKGMLFVNCYREVKMQSHLNDLTQKDKEQLDLKIKTNSGDTWKGKKKK